ncbi:MAG: cytochrome b [Burkholderiales bacterium]|nr:cytochrome b [Burkholderiales bacterium]
MQWKNTQTRYGAVSISLHWLMVLLIATVYATIEFRGIFPRGTPGYDAMKSTHFMLGLLVGLLALGRIAIRLLSPTPEIVPAPVAWQDKLAKLAHLLLYILMICLPLAGWLILSGRGIPVPFFGLELPPLMAQNKELAKQIKEIHETVATCGYALIGLHAAAALFHHYVVRDNTLLRMLPARQADRR